MSPGPRRGWLSRFWRRKRPINAMDLIAFSGRAIYSDTYRMTVCWAAVCRWQAAVAALQQGRGAGRRTTVRAGITTIENRAMSNIFGSVRARLAALVAVPLALVLAGAAYAQFTGGGFFGNRVGGV